MRKILLTIAMLAISAFAQVQRIGVSITTGSTPPPHRVMLNWTDADPVTFNMYRSTVSGGPYQLIASGLTSLNYTDSTVQSGTTYYYVVTAYNGQESSYSNEAPAVIPTP